MPLTPADVRNKQFTTTRLRAGYDEQEVDDFLGEVEAALDQLIQENEELRAKLAECMRSSPATVPVLAAPLAEALAAPAAEMPPPAMPAGALNAVNIDGAARVLALAQQTADQAIADAQRDAGELLDQARREADEILGQARSQAAQITSDARARAESLDRACQERHRQAMGSLTQEREELERRVGDLRSLEGRCSGRLRALAEGLLHDLEPSANGDRGSAAGGGDPQLVPADPGRRGGDQATGEDA